MRFCSVQRLSSEFTLVIANYSRPIPTILFLLTWRRSRTNSTKPLPSSPYPRLHDNTIGIYAVYIALKTVACPSAQDYALLLAAICPHSNLSRTTLPSDLFSCQQVPPLELLDQPFALATLSIVKRMMIRLVVSFLGTSQRSAFEVLAPPPLCDNQLLRSYLMSMLCL